MNNNGNYGRNSQHPDFIKQDLNPNNSYINTNIDELKKLISKYCVSYIHNLNTFSEQLYPSLNDGLAIWTNITAFMDTYQ